MKQTKAQQQQSKIYANASAARRAAEFQAAGVDVRFGSFIQRIEQAQEITAAGLTFDEWLPFRQMRWDDTHCGIRPTVQYIAAAVKAGKTAEQVHREMSRTYPAPQRSR